MGKDNKGKNIGKGICQRKDGLYSARFVDKSGKRQEKCFSSLPEARNWLEEARYSDKHNKLILSANTTLNDWFEFWIENIVGDLAPNTQRNYKERYYRNIQPLLGEMLLTEIKPLHCKLVFNQMESSGYAGSTIRQAYICMGTMLKSALNNDLIVKHPMNGVRFSKPVREVSDIKYLTVEEQNKFMEVAKQSHNYFQYAFLLETGLRVGELIALTWSDVDWENHTLSVTKTMEFRHKQGFWRAGPPKSQQSYRTIPLTNRAYEILKTIYANRTQQKVSDMLSQSLEYLDRHTGKKESFIMSDLIFINWRTGQPTKNSSYDTHLYKLCEKANIKHFSMHTLRHTYATRAIESGMQPKVLQRLLGHSSIKTTMDRYVHVTEDSMQKAVQQFELNSPT